MLINGNSAGLRVWSTAFKFPNAHAQFVMAVSILFIQRYFTVMDNAIP
jgi:hypothetical protein